MDDDRLDGASTESEDDDYDDHDSEDGRPSRSLSERAVAVPLLRIAAVMSMMLWAIGGVSAMWFQWSLLDASRGFGGPPGPSPILGALLSGLSAMWGYLLVAVVALTAAAFLGASDDRGAERAAE